MDQGNKSLTQGLSFAFINESGSFAKFKKMGFFSGIAIVLFAIAGLGVQEFSMLVSFVLLIVSFSALKEIAPEAEKAYKMMIVAAVLSLVASIVGVMVLSASTVMFLQMRMGMAFITSMLIPTIMFAMWAIPYALSFSALAKLFAKKDLFFYCSLGVVFVGALDTIFGLNNSTVFTMLSGAALAYGFATIDESQLLSNTQQ